MAQPTLHNWSKDFKLIKKAQISERPSGKSANDNVNQSSQSLKPNKFK